MEAESTTQTQERRLTRAERISINKAKTPMSPTMVYAMAHPHMLEVADPELRAQLDSYRD